MRCAPHWRQVLSREVTRFMGCKAIFLVCRLPLPCSLPGTTGIMIVNVIFFLAAPPPLYLQVGNIFNDATDLQASGADEVIDWLASSGDAAAEVNKVRTRVGSDNREAIR